MSLQSKVAALAAILIADLLFFYFFAVYYPKLFELILTWLPYDDSLEKAIIIITGLIIAVLTSTAIIYVLVKNLQKPTKQE
ncbi:MAG: hypothetical protein QXX08_08550 [Candidatus Bathyarchaeia archaeon]